MRYSFSATSMWWSCPFKYKLKYIDHLETKPDERAENPMYEGTAMHEAIEKRSINEGVANYKANYPELTKDHEIEIFKMEKLMEKAIKQIPECEEYEYKLLTDKFVGYIDGLVKVDEGVYDLYDFKFSKSSPSKYAKSGQIHIYKNFYERLTGNKIRDMYYAVIPKFSDKLTDDITEDKLKENFNNWLKDHDVQFLKVEYDPQQVSWFFARMRLMEKATSYEKRYTHECAWCEYRKYCSSNGQDRSELKEEVKEQEIMETNLWE